MSKLYGDNDAFSISPFLSLLPSVGSVSRLISLRSSLFARLENVSSLKSVESFDFNSEEGKRIVAEEDMLREVLKWIESHGEAS